MQVTFADLKGNVTDFTEKLLVRLAAAYLMQGCRQRDVPATPWISVYTHECGLNVPRPLGLWTKPQNQVTCQSHRLGKAFLGELCKRAAACVIHRDNTLSIVSVLMSRKRSTRARAESFGFGQCRRREGCKSMRGTKNHNLQQYIFAKVWR